MTISLSIATAVSAVAIPRVIAWAVKALLAWLERVLEPRPSDEAEPQTEVTTDRAPRSWDGGDQHRRQVAELYRRFLDLAEGVTVPRRPSETPSEYGIEVAGRLGAARDPVKVVTAEFNEARWTRHPIGPEDVARASSAIEDFTRLSAGADSDS